MDDGTTPVRPALLVGWVAALAAVIAGFTALGGGVLATPAVTDAAGWGAWADGRDPVVATAAVLRLVVLAMAWYLLGTTLVGALARLARWGTLVRVADLVSVPAVRRVVQASVGAGLAATVVVTSTGATVTGAPGPTAAAVVGQASSAGLDVLPPPGVAPPPTGPTTPAPMQPAPSAPRRTPEPATVEDGLVTVAPGDHLWAIAERHVTAARGADVSEAAVADYWARLVEANRGRLVDPDDPDLVLPGQRFVLPDLDEAGATP